MIMAIIMFTTALMLAVAMAAVATEIYAAITEEIIVAKAIQKMAADEEVTPQEAFRFMTAMAVR